jgi:hypothetical protein
MSPKSFVSWGSLSISYRFLALISSDTTARLIRKSSSVVSANSNSPYDNHFSESQIGDP